MREPPLPAWATSNLPEPPPWSARNALRVLGPGAFLLAVSLGAGEWLLGPLALTRHGPGILWLVTASVVLQTLLNTEMARYTLATGEPIFMGFMRTAPGPALWGWGYAGVHFLQLAWPGWALAAGTAAAALYLGHVPQAEDRGAVLYFGYLLFLISVLLVLRGERVEKPLEAVEGFMSCWTLVFLLLAALFLVPWSLWGTTAAGFVALAPGAPVPPGQADWLLLAALAAYAGAGGANATFTYWVRDKGLGMSATVGYLAATIGGQQVQISGAGVACPPDAENLRRWRGWWRYLGTDQWQVWVPGSLLGMALPGLLALAVIPPGTPLGSYGVAAHLAGALGERYGSLFWSLTLVAGLWLLFATQLANTGGCARVTADLLWTASEAIRGWRGGDFRGVYYRALLAFTLWGLPALALADPLSLVLIGAALACANLVFLSFHTLVVNRRLLPRPLRPSLLRQAGLVLAGLFFLGLALLALLQRLGL